MAQGSGELQSIGPLPPFCKPGLLLIPWVIPMPTLEIFFKIKSTPNSCVSPFHPFSAVSMPPLQALPFFPLPEILCQQCLSLQGSSLCEPGCLGAFSNSTFSAWIRYHAFVCLLVSRILLLLSSIVFVLAELCVSFKKYLPCHFRVVSREKSATFNQKPMSFNS